MSRSGRNPVGGAATPIRAADTEPGPVAVARGAGGVLPPPGCSTATRPEVRVSSSGARCPRAGRNPVHQMMASGALLAAVRPDHACRGDGSDQRPGSSPCRRARRPRPGRRGRRPTRRGGRWRRRTAPGRRRRPAGTARPGRHPRRGCDGGHLGQQLSGGVPAADHDHVLPAERLRRPIPGGVQLTASEITGAWVTRPERPLAPTSRSH